MSKPTITKEEMLKELGIWRAAWIGEWGVEAGGEAEYAYIRALIERSGDNERAFFRCQGCGESFNINELAPFPLFHIRQISDTKRVQCGPIDYIERPGERPRVTEEWLHRLVDDLEATPSNSMRIAVARARLRSIGVKVGEEER